jgi:hypothetical protein
MLSPRITEMMTERYPNSSTALYALCDEVLVDHFSEFVSADYGIALLSLRISVTSAEL